MKIRAIIRLVDGIGFFSLNVGKSLTPGERRSFEVRIGTARHAYHATWAEDSSSCVVLPADTLEEGKLKEWVHSIARQVNASVDITVRRETSFADT